MGKTPLRSVAELRIGRNFSHSTRKGVLIVTQ